MEEKNYKIIYKNGNELVCKAYSMELHDGKLYQCCKAFVGDQGCPSMLDGSKIESVVEM